MDISRLTDGRNSDTPAGGGNEDEYDWPSIAAMIKGKGKVRVRLRLVQRNVNLNGKGKVKIEIKEVYNTMLYVGKDKALSADGISDIIFKRKTWRKIG